MIIDVHAHCFPKPYLKEIEKIGVDEGRGIGTKAPEWSGSEERVAAMDALGIDLQVLSLANPNVYFHDSGMSRDLAQMTNRFISEICKKHPDRFMYFASVPMNHLNYAVDELDRVMGDPGMTGVVIGSNVNGRCLSEDPFLPVLEELDRRKIPLFLHPMRPIGQELMPPGDKKIRLPALVGYPNETTRTVAQMIFNGIFDRYKNLTFILPHLGGSVPFIYRRWEIDTLAQPDSHPMRKIAHLPSDYLKRQYYDTALSYYPSSMKCAIDLAGVDRILFGTDSPYTMTDFRAEETIEKIGSYGFSQEEQEKICFKNAIALFQKMKGKLSKERDKNSRK
ncbi:MAG: amidohydrolase family protein [Deltaproteobacteria bacterium]